MSDTEDRISFTHGAEFTAAQPTAGLSLGPMELQYQDLFAEALEDGIITVEERARLHKAASNLGLNTERLDQLEEAMTAAYETHHRVRVVDQTLTHHASLSPLLGAPPLSRGASPPVASAPPPLSAPKTSEAEANSAKYKILEQENSALKARISDLESELLRAQAAVNVEVDLSSLEFAAASTEDPAEVWRRVRLEPTDVEAHRALKEAYDAAGSIDGTYLACQALVALGAATTTEAALVEKHRPTGLIHLKASLSDETWRKSLAHLEEDPVVGAIFSVVAPAILVGKTTTMRRDGLLHHPVSDSKQDPAQSTIMGVRAVGWAAALLGLPVPNVYVEPQAPSGYTHTVGLPPFSVLGKNVLSGASISELAFAVGRHMSGYRGEHFVRTLFSGTEDLEDLFLAALLIANPKLPLKGAKRARIEPLARAIEPLLEARTLDTLRSHYLRFADEGGRTNLQRWSAAVDKTAARAGLTLCQDLPTALQLLSKEEGGVGTLSLDLLSYSTGPRFLSLRSDLGLSIKTY